MERRGLKVIVGRAALALLVPAFVAELVLQIAAWWIAGAAPIPTGGPAAARARSVLCVGDSYTFGIGASDAGHAYPARLAARLAERSGEEWSVQNGGWPGRNSRDVLRELPAQLERFEPAFVCLLVGTNDGWSRPAEQLRESWFAEASGSGFRFEWRSRRLAALVWNALRESGRAPASVAPDPGTVPRPGAEAAALLGSWNVAGSIARFDADGRCYWREVERRFAVEGGLLHLAARDELPAITAHWRVERGRLHLRMAGAAEETVHAPPRRRRTPVDPALAEALARGRRDAAQERLGELRALAASSPAAAGACLAAQVAFERGAPSVELARELLAKFPDQVELLAVLAEQAHGAGDDASARAAVERALELAPPNEPLLRADLHRTRALALRHREPREALRSIAESYRLDGDRERAGAALRAQREASTKDGTPGLLDTAGFEPEVQARLALLGASDPAGDVGDEEAVGAILESHLRQAITLCRSRGATPLLLSYPFRDRHQARVFARFSADSELQRVSLHIEFERLLQDHAREEFFVADGHCNDAGYEVIAGLVAEALLR